jgi:rubrerythrin
MSLFRTLGRRAERLKQQVVAASEATHECAECGTSLEGDLETCPECGSDDVVALD